MKTKQIIRRALPVTFSVAAALFVGACATTGDKSPTTSLAPPSPARYMATDGRTIDIGKSTPVNGGASYNNPHMEKGKCWVVDGFDFNGYDTIYVAPTLSTAKFPDKQEDTMVHNLAKENLVREIALRLNEAEDFRERGHQRVGHQTGRKGSEIGEYHHGV